MKSHFHFSHQIDSGNEREGVCARLSVFMDLNEHGKVFPPGDLVNPSHQPVSHGTVTSEEKQRACVHADWEVQGLHEGP